MKKILLVLAAVGMIFTACEPGGIDDDINNDPTEQPGGDNQGGEDNPDNPGSGNKPDTPSEDKDDIPADKTQAIKFQDENAKLLCTLHWDDNGDGELSYEEAAAVTDLGTAFKGSSILAFTELKNFTSLEKIADNAFEGCVSLVKITLPEQLTIIGTSAFNGCTNLKNIAIPNAVTEIGNYAFQNCNNLTSITIGNSVTSIGVEAFRGCTSLKSVTIPDSVTEIGYSAFSGCPSLTDTYVNITNLAAYAKSNPMHNIGGNKHLLVNDTEITELVIPDSVTSIGRDAFQYCTSLTSITIPDSVISIGYDAFWGCTSLTSVIISGKCSVTSIGDDTFYGCTSLKDTYVYITDLAAYAINNNTHCLPGNKHLLVNGTEITELVIPDGVTSIGGFAFIYCSSLKSVTIPDSVTSIGSSAFYNCTSLKSVTIGNSVTSIGKSAFVKCDSLTSITIPDSVTSIEYSAFSECTSLKSVTIGNSVTSIGESAFRDCTSLTSVTIPDSVNSIGEGAFYGCTSLTSVYCKPTTPPTGGEYMFDDNASGRKIYVPRNSVDAYKSASYWSSYASDIIGYDF